MHVHRGPAITIAQISPSDVHAPTKIVAQGDFGHTSKHDMHNLLGISPIRFPAILLHQFCHIDL